jgi:hypothetical protein
MKRSKKNKQQIDLILKGVRELEDSKKKLVFGFWVVFIMCCMSFGAIYNLLSKVKNLNNEIEYNGSNYTNNNSDKDLFQSFHSLNQIMLKQQF